MKKLLSFIGFTAAAVVSSTVVYLYMNDREVRNKVDAAIASVGDAVPRRTRRGTRSPATRHGPTSSGRLWASSALDI